MFCRIYTNVRMNCAHFCCYKDCTQVQIVPSAYDCSLLPAVFITQIGAVCCNTCTYSTNIPFSLMWAVVTLLFYLHQTPPTLDFFHRISNNTKERQGPGVAQWLRHCATSGRVPGSVPSHWGFFPGHQTVPCALGSTQPVKVSTRIFLGVKTAGA